MNTDLQALTVKALAQLELQNTPPQRYGTAFHISPPFLDVRDITLQASSVAQQNIEALTEEELQRLQEWDVSDTYLAWLLVHPKVIPLQIHRAAEGEKKNIVLENSGLVIIIAEKGSEISITDTILNQELSLRRVFVWQAEASVVSWMALRAGNVFLNEKIHWSLLGRSSSMEVTHLTHGSKKDQSDIEVKVYHQAKNTTSSMVVKTVADERHVGIYRGLINIAPNAGDSQGYQQGNALLVSRKAVVDMLPELEINTNSVKCSHGVNTTHLDEVTLFYMRSRGIKEEQARMLAVIGFYNKGLSIEAGIKKQLEAVIERSFVGIYDNI